MSSILDALQQYRRITRAKWEEAGSPPGQRRDRGFRTWHVDQVQAEREAKRRAAESALTESPANQQGTARGADVAALQALAAHHGDGNGVLERLDEMIALTERGLEEAELASPAKVKLQGDLDCLHRMRNLYEEQVGLPDDVSRQLADPEVIIRALLAIDEQSDSPEEARKAVAVLLATLREASSAPARYSRTLEDVLHYAWTRGKQTGTSKTGKPVHLWTSDTPGQRPRRQIIEPGSRGKKDQSSSAREPQEPPEADRGTPETTVLAPKAAALTLDTAAAAIEEYRQKGGDAAGLASRLAGLKMQDLRALKDRLFPDNRSIKAREKALLADKLARACLETVRGDSVSPEPAPAASDIAVLARAAADLHGSSTVLPGHLDMAERAHNMVEGSSAPRGEPEKQQLESVIAEAQQQENQTDAGSAGSNRAGGERAGEPSTETGGPVAAETGRSADAGAGEGGNTAGEPAGTGPAQRVPASLPEINRRLERFENFFRSRGQHAVTDWMRGLRNHVNAVGGEAALAALALSDEEVGKGYHGDVQYIGADRQRMIGSMGQFAEQYLERNGIILLNSPTGEVARASAEMPAVSAWSSLHGFVNRGPSSTRDLDFRPGKGRFKNKLDEARQLPGLETSEDLNALAGQPVTHVTDDVIAKLDDKYGKGQWIVKAYNDEAAAGFGVYFAQRLEQIRNNARNLIWTANKEIGHYGFALNRDEAGRITGIRHENGDTYDFDTEKFDQTIHGDVRQWCDRLTATKPIRVAAVSGGKLGEDKQDVAGSAIDNERGAMLPGTDSGQTQFMVQPAFPVVGVSEEERASGKTIAPGEARVHVATRDGKVSVIPYSTWIKGESLPVVFDDENTREMARAVEDAVARLPKKHRNGQVYAPDVLRTADGYKVVELNGGTVSGYLYDNPFIIDAYVSHFIGREPEHVRFIRNLLTTRKKEEKQHDTAGEAQQGGREGGEVRSEASPGNDASAASGGDRPQRPGGQAIQHAAQTFANSGVAALPKGDWGGYYWDLPHDIKQQYNDRLFQAARDGGFFIPPHELPHAVLNTPNVGGSEHDVHQDAAHNTYYKLTRNNPTGKNNDPQSYLKRHELANEIWPSLGYKFVGMTHDFSGTPQMVMSMNRISGHHPEQHEVDEWFRANGWEQSGQHTWRDPQSGTIIDDTHPGNFIKNEDGLVPIDVDVLPGNPGAAPVQHRKRRSLLRYIFSSFSQSSSGFLLEGERFRSRNRAWQVVRSGAVQRHGNGYCHRVLARPLCYTTEDRQHHLHDEGSGRFTSKNQGDTAGADQQPPALRRLAGKLTGRGTRALASASKPLHVDALGKQVSHTIFGRELAANEYQGLGGGQPGSKVTVNGSHLDSKGRKQHLEIASQGDGYHSKIEFTHDTRTGKTACLYNIIEVDEDRRNSPLAMNVLAAQVQQLHDLGIKQIDATAARSEERGFIGFKVWPKLGFDGWIPHITRDKLPEHLQAAQTVQELYAMPGGRQAWEEHGASFKCHLNLDSESGQRALKLMQKIRARSGGSREKQ